MIVKANAEYTGGGIYRFTAQLNDKRYVVGNSEWDGLYIVDEDPDATEESWYNEWFDKHVVEIVKDIAYEDDQLNLSPFDDIKHLDKRSFLATYWSFVKFKQTIIFTFYTKSDGILRSTKIALFFIISPNKIIS